MAKQKSVFSPSSPKPAGPYSPAIVWDRFVFVSGQIGIHPETRQLPPGGVAAETAQALENLKAVLESAGSSLSKVLRATVFLRSMDDFAAMNEVYAKYFPDTPPARTTVAVAGLPLDARVEIDLIAYLE